MEATISTMPGTTVARGIETVDDVRGRLRFFSIDGSGTAHISYCDANNYDLGYATSLRHVDNGGGG